MLTKQARRDLNPQPPDLESGALAVRATGPFHDSTTAELTPIPPEEMYPPHYLVSR